uniref:Uncharacterized protein n=1 Tax=Coniferiporia sulphurascens TaxID=175648 RepID=A0A5B9RB23_CONSH|nr:hypothetical protein PSUO_000072 [Coniferiporia sulphurascens]QEG57156.1 hypothetical protein PSUO_000072 [Coniferiporia sulphurascens]
MLHLQLVELLLLLEVILIVDLLLLRDLFVLELKISPLPPTTETVPTIVVTEASPENVVTEVDPIVSATNTPRPDNIPLPQENLNREIEDQNIQDNPEFQEFRRQLNEEYPPLENRNGSRGIVEPHEDPRFIPTQENLDRMENQQRMAEQSITSDSINKEIEDLPIPPVASSSQTNYMFPIDPERSKIYVVANDSLGFEMILIHLQIHLSLMLYLRRVNTYSN